MKIAFFNCLRLEYEGGTARFFSDASLGLKKKYPSLDISIVTLDKRLMRNIHLLYSVYFQRKVSRELKESKENLKMFFKRKRITYETIKNLAELRERLKEFDSVYSKNDILEAFILKFIVGYENLKKVIFGFHTPIYYERPYNWQSRLHNFLYNSFFYRYLIREANKFHVLNSYDEKELKRHFKNKVIQKIYNPFQSFWPHSSRQGRDSRGKQAVMTRILWVGRLTKEKGIDDLIKLINLLNNSVVGKKIYWSIVGSGEFEDEIKKLGLKYKNVNYFSYVKNQELVDIYKQNDLFISTSRWESFPYTFLEAQSFGLPIISYNIHGCNEIIKDNVNGYLVNSLEKFKNKLVDLVENRKKVIKGNFIKKRIRELINNEEIYEKLYNLFTN